MKRDRFFLSQIPTNPTEAIFDKSEDWMQEILNDLHEQLDPSEVAAFKDQEDIRFEGTLVRRVATKYGDYIVLEGEISAKFFTYCVNTGDIMQDQIFASVKAVFIDESFSEKYQLQEETTLFLDDDEYELYFLENNKCHIPRVINEFIFLNKNPYPKKISAQV